jgi:hypothetical protein
MESDPCVALAYLPVILAKAGIHSWVRLAYESVH